MNPQSRKRRWPTTPLRDKMANAAKGEVTSGASLEVSLLIEGGAPGERYLELVAFDTDGHATYRIEDKLEKRRLRTTKARLDPGQLTHAFESIRDCGRSDFQPDTELIPPDSFVGTLTVRSGKRQDSIHFRVEEIERQAKLAAAQSPLKLYSKRKLAVPRKTLPARFLRAVESMSKVAALIAKK